MFAKFCEEWSVTVVFYCSRTHNDSADYTVTLSREHKDLWEGGELLDHRDSR